MSEITLINNVKEFPAEFRVFQEGKLMARISAQKSGGRVVIPTTDSFVAVARTTVDGFDVTSGPQYFDTRSRQLLAQVLEEDGGFDFQLVDSVGTQPDQIVCENTWRNAVQFDIKKNGSPMGAVVVADEHNNVSVGTADNYEIYAIVNGITTSTLATDNPNATVTSYDDNDDSGYSIRIG